MPRSARPTGSLHLSILTLALTTFFVQAPVGAQQAATRQASAQPAAAPPAGETYTLHPGDQLEIGVWKEPELQKTVVVRPDGRFSFPLVGEVVASGRGVAQVQTEIENKLKRYMPEPVLSITLTNVGGNKIYVIGQVKNPGAFIMNPQVNILQALSLAGGMTPFASVNNISVIKTRGGRQSVVAFRYEDVSKGRNVEQNVMLESGDVIVVP
jgi:polysaccharide export outer membrane protein